MKINIFLKNKKLGGYALLEILIAASVMGVGLLSIIAAYLLYERYSFSTIRSAQGMMLAEEGIEAVKVLRDSSWSHSVGAFNVDTPYFMSFSTTTNSWNLQTTPVSEVDAIFYRKVVFENVNRNANDQITTNGGVPDTNTRLVTVTVSWLDRAATSSALLSSYLTNLFSN